MFLHWTIFESPLGAIRLEGNGAGLSQVFFLDKENTEPLPPTLPSYLERAKKALEAYFEQGQNLDAALCRPTGTAFQKAVWQAAQQIPYGQTGSYLSLALELGARKAVRAVGAALAKNPLALFIPCHRVIARDGKLLDFAWGIDRKKALLQHECPERFQEQGRLF